MTIWKSELAAGPAITVPTITLEGDTNGAPHPEPSAYRQEILGQVHHRLIKGGVGHNLPRRPRRPSPRRSSKLRKANGR